MSIKNERYVIAIDIKNSKRIIWIFWELFAKNLTSLMNDHKEGWAPKKWNFQMVVLEKTLESLLNSKEIKPVRPKGNQSWIFIRITMLKLKLQYFGHLMRRVDSLGRTLMLRGIGGRRRSGWQRMRWLDGITDSMEFEWTPGVGDGQGGLVCCDSWGCKDLDTTEWLNWTENIYEWVLDYLPYEWCTLTFSLE